MEHVWVRSYIPYTDYRGAGDASGSSVWLDLDTGIKSYENMEYVQMLKEKNYFKALEKFAI